MTTSGRQPRRRAAGAILLALAGLAVAVALSLAASNLSTQPIGLSAEPLSAGRALAPQTAPSRVKPRSKRRRAPSPITTRTTTVTVPVPTVTVPVPTPKAGGEDRGGGRESDD